MESEVLADSYSIALSNEQQRLALKQRPAFEQKSSVAPNRLGLGNLVARYLGVKATLPAVPKAGAGNPVPIN
jgi:hypothetical protein